MCLLDKYILRRIILRYISILIAFTLFHIMIDVFANLSDFLENKASLFLILQYYLYMFPVMFARVSPFSLVISVLYTLAELNKNNEIISIRSSGVSTVKIALPIIFFSILLSFIALFAQENIVINSQRKVSEIKDIVLKGKKNKEKIEKNLAFLGANKIFFVQTFYPQKNILEDVTMFQENKTNNITKKVICKRVTYSSNIWWGENVIEYSIDNKGSIRGIPKYWNKIEIPIEDKPAELILKKSSFSQYTSLKNLRKDIIRCKNIKAYHLLNNFVITFYQKILDPFSHLFLIIGILPFALEIRKRLVRVSALAMGFIFTLVYYMLSSIIIAFGKAGFIMPLLAAWLTPLFFLIMGIIGLKMTR